jgi:hypothetical protein
MIIQTGGEMVGGEPSGAACICLGGPINWERLRHSLKFTDHVL